MTMNANPPITIPTMRPMFVLPLPLPVGEVTKTNDNIPS